MPRLGNRRGADHPVAIDQGRFAIAPDECILPPKSCAEVFLPDLLGAVVELADRPDRRGCPRRRPDSPSMAGEQRGPLYPLGIPKARQSWFSTARRHLRVSERRPIGRPSRSPIVKMRPWSIVTLEKPAPMPSCRQAGGGPVLGPLVQQALVGRDVVRDSGPRPLRPIRGVALRREDAVDMASTARGAGSAHRPPDHARHHQHQTTTPEANCAASERAPLG